LSKLIDKYNRRIDYLRLSVTDRCNLRCIYCMPPEGLVKLHHDEILSYEELLRFTGLALEMGISKVRITGGEPLVRKNLDEFIANLNRLVKGRALSLTTNGILLFDMAKDLKRAGIIRLNISIDSLDPEVYNRITRIGNLNVVLKGLERALELGFNPVKINVVPLKGINEDMSDFIHLLREMPVHVRFIELMPISLDGQELIPITRPELEENLKQLVDYKEIAHVEGTGPSVDYHVKGAKGTLGFISPLSNHFCESCNRLRLTSEGRLLTCLFSKEYTDIRGILRSNASDHEVKGAILRALAKKPKGKNMAGRNLQMSKIGG
jgi:cyclic pyranopterin phosphate synthase